MLQEPILIPPTSAFWEAATRVLLGKGRQEQSSDLSGLRVVVPAFAHAQSLKAALAAQAGGTFIPPRITTMSAWCAMLPPDSDAPTAAGARLTALYAELRQHAWLKKLFSARRNTDLMPLAQLLLTMCDELTLSLLPALRAGHDAADLRWQQALQQLSPAARNIVSDESQLVWSIWKTQIDSADPLVWRLRQMMRLAQREHGHVSEPLIWIASAAPDPFEQAFLRAYGERQDVQPILPDWSQVDIRLAVAWPEMLEDASPANAAPHAPAAEIPGIDTDALQHVALCAAAGMEDEAQRCAQTIVDWLQSGKSRIAVVAQDRVAARRLRALLERAQVVVADETGWKLSTTRAASAVSAWFDVVATRGETAVLLDLLKSPFVFADRDAKQAQLNVFEILLRNANVLGGWEAVSAALAPAPQARELAMLLAQEAVAFGGRKTIAQWGELTAASLAVLGMWQGLQADAAGAQVATLLQKMAAEGAHQSPLFSFAEWRAFVALQMESTTFVAPGQDRRVVMLTLSGTQLRSFDAVWVLGCDADHLPASSVETLFFANTVRRELGLSTRESEQRRQLRDFAALLGSNDEVVLSWQTHHDGEPNPLSPWIERLQLNLQRAGRGGLRSHQVSIVPRHLQATPVAMPQPSAPHLLPAKLSASAYNSLVACPYQFFATRMLGLSGLDELSDMPEKRDYGDWLHRILREFHESVRDRAVPLPQREPLLREISAALFEREAAANAAALGYYVRWQKAMPAYLAWVERREADGWRFAFGERKFEKTLQWDDGQVVLHGRIDRIDQSDTEESALLDYKTRNAAALRDKLKQGEDRQLAFYGILSDAPLEYAHYVPLEPMGDKIDTVNASNYPQWRQQVEQQLSANMQALAHDATLPATGVEAVCEYCAVRGLCRKGAW